MPDPSKAVAVTDVSDRPGTPGFWQRARAALNYAFTGDIGREWFSPLRPLEPIVPRDQQDSVEGRQWQYQVGENIRIIPRINETIGFTTMRDLATTDLPAIIINGRKDQLAKLEWSIQPRDKTKRRELASQADQVQEWWRKPDQRHTWREWLSMLLDDLLVIDAPCLYVERDRLGRVWGFQPVDGSHIKPLIDAQGHRPIPPNFAYIHELYGAPAVLYTHDQLIYKPRTLRSYSLYGYSPLERVIVTVNTALRRQVQQLDHFTEGSIPDVIAGAPKDWTPQQIETFNQRWNARLSGNVAERARLHMIPDGATFHSFPKWDLKDEFDEWLARVMCAAYGVDPTPFIKQVNRGTQETTREAALAEGLAPYQSWISELVDDCLERQGFGFLRHSWIDDDAIDPVEKATIVKTKIAAGTLHPNEARADEGLDPLDNSTIAWLFAMQHSPTPVPPPETWQDGQPPAAEQTGAAPSPPAQSSRDSGSGAAANSQDQHATGGTAAGKGAAAIELGKAAAPARLDRGRRLVKEKTERIARALTKTFRKMAPDIASQIADALPKREKGARGIPDRVIDDLNLDALAAVLDSITDDLSGVAQDGARLAADQVGVEVDLDLANEDATAWARKRGAELVGKRYNKDGELVDNSRAKYAITDGTREHLRGMVVQAMDEGWSNDTLASNIKASYAFSAARAEVIARTETARADVAGNLVGWQASGVVERKRWLVGDDCCPECCELDGVEVDLDEDFPGEGGDGPPLHPNCRCDIAPVVVATEEETA